MIAMRTSVGLLGGIIILMVGIRGLSLAGQRSQDHAYNSSNASSEAWNTTDAIFSGVGEGAFGGWALMAIAAFMLVAVALTLTAARSGGGR